jgi:hypothetical protein
MQFQVPQFIETEDKLIWSLTLKQFLYLAFAGGFVFMLFFYVETWLWFVLASFIGALGAAFAFLRINGRPFSYFVIAAAKHVWHPHEYVFRPDMKRDKKDTPAPKRQPSPFLTPPTFGTLKKLFDKINTSKEAIPQRENPLIPHVKLTQSQERIKERYELVRNITGDREKARRVDYR